MTATIEAAILLDDCTMLVLGRDATPLPESGPVNLGAGTAVGSFASLSWQSDAGGEGWFLAVLRGEAGAMLAMRRADLAGRRIPRPSRIGLDSGPLVGALQEAGPAMAPMLVDFLSAQPEAERVLSAFLAAASREDGYVEIFGRTHGRGLYLQGWSVQLWAGPAELIIETDRIFSSHAVAVSYDRPDLTAPAHGICLALPASDLEPSAIRALYVRAGGIIYRLTLFESRLLFGDRETGVHVGSMLPAMRGEPPMLAAFKRVAAPRFEGEDTLSCLDAPVRAAIDIAVWIPGAGFFLAGWLLDPEDRVAEASLCGTNGIRSQLDQEWIRIARPDVTSGYSSDPLFAGRLGRQDEHGFMAFVPVAARDPGAFYLELTLSDDRTGMMPLSPTINPGPDSIRRILSGFDLGHPDMERIIARHVGPLVCARAPDAAPLRAARSHPFGSQRGERRISAVIPVAPGRTDIDVTLARLAVDPDFDQVEILVVAPSTTASALAGQLQRQARFYGLSGRLLVQETADPCAALAIGAEAAQSDLLLFLSAGVFPRRSGWLGHLERLLAAAPRAAAISPTLLYEDDSIRFAGTRANNWLLPRDVRSLTSFAGYSRHWLPSEVAEQGAVPVHAITAECCLLRRPAFRQVGGFSAEFNGSEYRALDLSLKFKSERMLCLWASTIELVAVDEQQAEPEYWMRTGALVDRWGFERKWAQSFTQGNV